MAVIENLDIVLGARTTKFDQGIDSSTRRANRFKSDIAEVNQAVRAASQPVTNLGRDFLLLVPGMNAAGTAFAAFATLSATQASKAAQAAKDAADASKSQTKVISDGGLGLSVYSKKTKETTVATTEATKATAMFSGRALVAGGAIAGAFIGVAAAAKATKVVIGEVAEQMGEIDAIAKAAQQANVSFAELSGFRLVVGETTGLGPEAADKAVTKLQIRLSEAARNGGALADQLRAVGLDAGQLLEQGPLAALQQISAVTRDMKNPSDQLVLAYRLFEEEGSKLVNTLRAGPDAINDTMRAAEQLGLTLTEAQARQVEAANDAWARVQLIGTGAFRQIAAEASVAITVISNDILGLELSVTSVSNATRLMVDGFIRGLGLVHDAMEIAKFDASDLAQLLSGDLRGALDLDTDKADAAINRLYAARQAAVNAAQAPTGSLDIGAIEAEEEAARAKVEAERSAAETAQRSAEQQQEAIRSRIQALRDEVATIHEGATAVERRQLAEQGATAAQLADYDRLIAARRQLQQEEEERQNRLSELRQREGELLSAAEARRKNDEPDQDTPNFGALQKGSVEAFSAARANEQAAKTAETQRQRQIALAAEQQAELARIRAAIASLEALGNAG